MHSNIKMVQIFPPFVLGHFEVWMHIQSHGLSPSQKFWAFLKYTLYQNLWFINYDSQLNKLSKGWNGAISEICDTISLVLHKFTEFFVKKRFQNWIAPLAITGQWSSIDYSISWFCEFYNSLTWLPLIFESFLFLLYPVLP